AVLLIPGVLSILKGTPAGSIEEIYGPNADISGWVNISLEGETITTNITASFGGKVEKTISIKELLEENPSYKHTCNPLNCTDNYITSNGQTTKTYYVTNNKQELVGFKLEGKIQSIDSVKFNIASSEGPSCESQIKLDILNDEEIDLINKKVHATELCQPKSYGCFNSSRTTTEFSLIPGKQYCQKLNLTQYPGFQLGAWIKKASGASTIVMSLHDLDGKLKGSCDLTSVGSTTGQEYSCAIDYLVSEPKEHILCIYPSGGTGSYKIKGYPESNNACGYPGEPTSTTETAAYNIFVQGRKFDSVGTIQITNILAGSSENLANKVWNYLIKTYGIIDGKIDCSTTEGCTVPTKIFPKTYYNTISVENLEITYSTDAGQIIDTKFYDITTSPAKATSEAGRIFLNKLEIKTPSEFGNHTLEIKMGTQTIFSQKIEVKNVPIIQSVTPLHVAATFPTEFVVDVSTPKDTAITGYVWNFGENQTITSIKNTTTHVYPTNGSYELEITVIDTRGLSSSKTFTINVTSPRKLINTTLDKLSKNLDNIQREINSQIPSSRSVLNIVLNISGVTNEISSLKNKYSNSETDQDYQEIVSSLLKLDVPEKIILTTKANAIKIFPEEDLVNINTLKEISGGGYDADESLYSEAVAFWQQENVDVEISFEEFSAEYASEIKNLAGIFEIKVTKKKDISHDYYLIMPKQNLEFISPIREEGDYIYVNLKDISKVNFYTTESINLEDIRAFVAPPMNKLAVEGQLTPSNGDKNISRGLILVMSLILLLVLAITAYIILQQWYKKKYEKHLFPNRNDLYNIMHYINNAKKKEHTHEYMKKNLKKAGWHTEQIKYALKKYDGRRTGMMELPLPRFIKEPKEKSNK
ncbi:MAG: PKD domain-containing protein, partial [Nanoarchaeota archaeon]|nr:PKD domain-containing protein [Nanoarchaeota archaeon]